MCSHLFRTTKSSSANSANYCGTGPWFFSKCFVWRSDGLKNWFLLSLAAFVLIEVTADPVERRCFFKIELFFGARGEKKPIFHPRLSKALSWEKNIPFFRNSSKNSLAIFILAGNVCNFLENVWNSYISEKKRRKRRKRRKARNSFARCRNLISSLSVFFVMKKGKRGRHGWKIYVFWKWDRFSNKFYGIQVLWLCKG